MFYYVRCLFKVEGKEEDMIFVWGWKIGEMLCDYKRGVFMVGIVDK